LHHRYERLAARLVSVIVNSVAANAAVLSTHFLIEACQSCQVAVGRDFHRSQFRSIAANDIDRRTDSNFGPD
jgi:hypothetical protein